MVLQVLRKIAKESSTQKRRCIRHAAISFHARFLECSLCPVICQVFFYNMKLSIGLLQYLGDFLGLHSNSYTCSCTLAFENSTCVLSNHCFVFI